MHPDRIVVEPPEGPSATRWLSANEMVRRQRLLQMRRGIEPGGTATVSYRGLYDGDTPDDGSGDIVMSSWLVVYE